MQIFLAPRSNETSYKNFLSTIENGVDFSIIGQYLTDEGKKILQNESKLFVWGNKETKKTSWDKMEVGDLILFYKGREGEEREGKLLYAGKLLFKQHSKDLGLALWPPKKGEEPWTCIFFLKDLQPIYIPISELADFAGYSRNFIVQGFMPINDEGVKNILNKFGSVDNFLKSYTPGNNKIEISDLEEAGHISEENAHKEAQMLLLKIGRVLDFDTFSPNKSPTAYDEPLESYISLKELPRRFVGEEILTFVKNIDVIWFRDEIPAYAFEVENSTGVRSGFQRLIQLRPLGTKLYIIAREDDRRLYAQILNADPYYRYKDSFRFISYSQLEKFFVEVDRSEAIKKAFLK